MDWIKTSERLPEREYIRPYSVKIIFAWYDLWIGIFIDTNKKLIYVFPLPMIGIRFKYGYRHYKPFGNEGNSN